jgi:hypothetical protein
MGRREEESQEGIGRMVM